MNRMMQQMRLSRREALRIGALGAGGYAIAPNLFGSAPPSGREGKAKSVIQIWMWGGPCHIDTFDPKPDAGNEITGPLNNPIGTNVEGVRISELLPLLAKQADKYSLIRSMTHGVNAHETASYMVQTGRQSGDGQVYPSIGAVVSLFKGYKGGYTGALPPYIVLTESQGRFSEPGFLGAKYKPFVTGGDPAQRRFAVEGLAPQGISKEREIKRRALLEEMDLLRHAVKGDPRVEAWMRSEQEADAIASVSGQAFDLALEKDEVRERYGRTTFGQSCLVARRLVERGVPYITINYKGWDTHQQHFETMRRKLPEFDRGLATLLEDLSERGLLESTVVWAGGEFGRTPKVQWEAPWNGGRNHHGKAFSALVAGGGFKGGYVLGATDKFGEEVIESAVHPPDLIGSVYRLMGIDPNATLPHPQGLEIRLLPPRDKAAPEGDVLKTLIA